MIHYVFEQQVQLSLKLLLLSDSYLKKKYSNFINDSTVIYCRSKFGALDKLVICLQEVQFARIVAGSLVDNCIN